MEALLAAGRPAEALSTFDKYLRPVENTSFFEALHVASYAYGGDMKSARQLLDNMSGPQNRALTSPADLALANIAVHDFTKAAYWLEQAYREHNGDLEYLKTDPLYDPMRQDPRFQDIYRRMHFPG